MNKYETIEYEFSILVSLGRVQDDHLQAGAEHVPSLETVELEPRRQALLL